MLGCKITKGISASCDTNVAGVKRIWLANYTDKQTFQTATGSCEVETIDLDGQEWLEIAVEDQSASAVAEMAVGSSNDSKYINHIVSGQISRLNCDLLGDFKNYLLGTVIAAVETNNKEVYIFGADNGMVATTFSFGTGTANGDASGINFQFEGAQSNAPLKASLGLIVGA